jgi:hypothetical protein
VPSVPASDDHRPQSAPDSFGFTFSGLDLPDSADPLGVWQFAPSPVTATARFAAQTAPPPEQDGLRWHIELPAADSESRAELSRRLSAVDRRQAQVDQVERRFWELQSSQLIATRDAKISYAALPDPESELLRAVAALQHAPTAFAMDMRDASAYREILDKAEQLLLQFRRLVQYYARVETKIGAQWVGLTVVDWSGDYRTTWQDGVTASDMARHLDALKLAMASRHALLRLVSVVTSGALALATKASVPGGQVLLLPAVYNYVRDVLEEFDRYAESQGLAG